MFDNEYNTLDEVIEAWEGHFTYTEDKGDRYNKPQGPYHEITILFDGKGILQFPYELKDDKDNLIYLSAYMAGIWNGYNLGIKVNETV